VVEVFYFIKQKVSIKRGGDEEKSSCQVDSLLGKRYSSFKVKKEDTASPSALLSGTK